MPDKIMDVLKELYGTAYADGNGENIDEDKEISKTHSQLLEIFKEITKEIEKKRWEKLQRLNPDSVEYSDEYKVCNFYTLVCQEILSSLK